MEEIDIVMRLQGRIKINNAHHVLLEEKVMFKMQSK